MVGGAGRLVRGADESLSRRGGDAELRDADPGWGGGESLSAGPGLDFRKPSRPAVGAPAGVPRALGKDASSTSTRS
jgi:hypothetical protein